MRPTLAYSAGDAVSQTLAARLGEGRRDDDDGGGEGGDARAASGRVSAAVLRGGCSVLGEGGA
eukprot:3875729-Prymnesium_polylepis.1